MIEFKHIIGERVALGFMPEDDDDADEGLVHVITGIAAYDEEHFMFQIIPDEDMAEVFENGERFGIGAEVFENDVIVFLAPDDPIRQDLDCKYMIVI